MLETETDLVFSGWLDRKGRSLITPWNQRWVIVTMDHVRVYRNQDLSELKVDLTVDETTRVMYVDHPINSFFRFCIANSKDIIELSSPDVDVRNLWMKKLAYVAGKKSGLGGHIMRVASEADYKNVGQWEAVVVADSIAKSTGLLVFQNVPTEVPYRFTGSVQPQQHLTVVADNDPQFASFLPFEEWQQAFEAEVIAAAEEAKKIDELKAQGYKIPDPSVMDRARDYLVDRVVTSTTDSSTTTFCNRLLEGMVQLLATAERQLALKYKLALASKQNLAVISSTTKVEEAVNPVGHSLPKSTPPIAESVQDISDASLLVMTAKPSEDTQLPAEDDIPLPIQADLLSVLGSLRGLILSYRFDNKPENAEQLRFIRRLSVHHMQKSLYQVLKSLEELQKQTIEKIMHELEHQMNEASVEGGASQISEQAEAKAAEQLDKLTAKFIELPLLTVEEGGRHEGKGKDEGEGKEETRGGQHEGAREGEGREDEKKKEEGTEGACWPIPHTHEGEGEGEGEGEHGEKTKAQGQGQGQGPEEGDGKDEKGGAAKKMKKFQLSTKDAEVPPEDMPSPSDTPYERGVKVRKAAQRQLRSILRPLLNRDFLHMDVAPLVEDFMRKNETNLEQLADLAEEVAATFGDTTQKFVQKKTTEVEDMIVTQLDKLTETIAEFAEAAPTPEEMSDLVKGKMKAGLQDVMGKLDDPALQHEEPASFPTTQHDVMVRLARVKAAVDKKIQQITTEHGAEWDGNYSTLVEMVLLEQTDELWVQLQEAVRLCISKSIYALLYLTGSGLKTPPGHHLTHTNKNAPSPPPSPKVPPPSSGYFF